LNPRFGVIPEHGAGERLREGGTRTAIPVPLSSARHSGRLAPHERLAQPTPEAGMSDAGISRRSRISFGWWLLIAFIVFAVIAILISTQSLHPVN
jgi:hypothetical protein